MISALLSNFSNSDKSNKDNNDESNGIPNIDMDTLLKMKTVMEKMNSKDDPRSKLLLSLKPYLRSSRKDKVDQYIKFLGMGSVIDAFGLSGGGKQK